MVDYWYHSCLSYFCYYQYFCIKLQKVNFKKYSYDIQTQNLSPVTRYYECEILTTGLIKMGWALESAGPVEEIGMDGTSFAFDGLYVRRIELCILLSFNTKII